MALAALALAATLLAQPAGWRDTPQTVCESPTSDGRYTPQQQIQACTTMLRDYQLTSGERAIVHYNRGRAWFDAGDHAQAVADYGEAIRYNPGYAQAYYNRGTSLDALRRYPEAIADFTQAIRINPNYTQAYLNRGAARARNGDLQGGVDDFSAAIRLDPNLGIAWRNRSIAYRMLGDTARSESDAARAAQLGN